MNRNYCFSSRCNLFLNFIKSISPEGYKVSTKTGLAPVYETDIGVATKVIAGTITSSPFPMSKASNAKCRALVPEFTPIANFELQYFLKLSSKAELSL